MSSLIFLISSIPRLEAPSISITSKFLASDISLQDIHFAHPIAGFCLQFKALEMILAVVVFPTPLGPVNIYA